MTKTGNVKKAPKTIFVRWVRSGIGFSKHQKEMVRSLGLRRLNQTVELQDTPPVRGLVASIPHLVEVVPAPAQSALGSSAEYSIRAAKAAAPRPQPAAEAPAPSASGEEAKE